jgi:hypothetical protein
MKTFAILIGINDYKHAPLTASVNDAVKMRDALIENNIVQESDCVLLTAPATAGTAASPTRQEIGDRLYEARENKGGYDRLIVFFSGHGEMTFVDADQAVPRTVILPVDYQGKPQQRYLNIDVDELLGLYRIAGPEEQIFIFDCCRKQASVVGKGAGGGPLMWPATQTGQERAQAALYGVALKGVAHAAPHDLGLMTKHILAGLKKNSGALDFLIDRDLFGVTIETLSEYVESGVREDLKNSGFEANYDLPRLVPRGPRTSPFLVQPSEEVPDRSLTVVIEPPEAIPVAKVSLMAGPNPLRAWPPSNVAFDVPPVRYGIRASVALNPQFLPPEPPFDTVDVRRTSERVVKFRRVGSAPGSQQLASPAVVVDAPEDVMLQFELRHGLELRDTGALPITAATSRIVANAKDRLTFVEVVGLQAPFDVESGFVQPHGDPSFEAEVEPGLYEVRFKLGPKVYSRATIEALAGRATQVTATAGASPLVFEIMSGRFTDGSGFKPTGQISEAIGDLQGGVAATLLPALAMRPFDRNNQFLRSFPVDLRIPQERWPLHPLSIVIGIDGDLGNREPSWDALFRNCVLTVEDMRDRKPYRSSVPLQPLSDDTQLPGLHRLAHAILDAPAPQFKVTLRSDLLPFPISIFLVSLPRRVTALTMLIVPGKSFDVSLNLLQYPDEAEHDEAGNYNSLDFPRRLRMLQIAQQLFASRQLYSHDEFLDLLWFKWLDPIVGVMAMLELLRTPAEKRGPWAGSMNEAASNLDRYFPHLPDVKVVLALQFPERRTAAIANLKRRKSIPVLAECLRHLAIMLEEDSDEHAWSRQVVRLASRLQLGQPWSVITTTGDFQ